MKLLKEVLFALVLILFTASAQAETVFISWDPSAGASRYIIYYSNNRQEVITKTSPSLTVYSRTSACLDFNFDTHPTVHVGIVACNSQACSVLSEIGYLLFGNIVDGFNEGISYTNARIDGQDLTALSLYFGQEVEHNSYNCNNNFQLIPQTTKQRADLNKDGIIDGRDLLRLAPRFGRIANQ